MPTRQEGIPAQPVHVVTGTTAEKEIQSPACSRAWEQARLRAWLPLMGVFEKETSLGPAWI